MLRRVEDQCRVKNGEAERREDLNEEQRGRSLRSRGEEAFKRLHRALISAATPTDVKPAHDGRSKSREVAVERCGKQPRYNPHARLRSIRVQRVTLRTLIDGSPRLPRVTSLYSKCRTLAQAAR